MTRNRPMPSLRWRSSRPRSRWSPRVSAKCERSCTTPPPSTPHSLIVTSPSPGDGKSVVATNLAAGLALNGRRILLVDANFRRPMLHTTFVIDNTTGFSDVLNDIALFEEAVHETEVPNLSVMVSGERPANPTELLESQLFLDFIERASKSTTT